MTRTGELQWPESGNTKLQALFGILREMESVIVAFSGGADSSLLAAAAHRALGSRALAVTAVSPTFPARDRDDAVRLVRAHGWAHRFIETDELDDEQFAANPPDRCYHCKRELFSRLREIADAENFKWVVDASNVDDLRDYRPGARAKSELHVRSPLQEAGFRKAYVHEAARLIGLDTAGKPASACLASRFPYGTPITHKGLDAVARAERTLAAMGFSQVRVRAHGDIARIEITPKELARAAEQELRVRIAQSVRECGFRYVALDLDGYRMGSLNEALEKDRL